MRNILLEHLKHLVYNNKMFVYSVFSDLEYGK